MHNIRKLAASVGASLTLLLALGGTVSAEPASEPTSTNAPGPNLVPVTPDMLPKLLKKAPAGALPPRPAGVAPTAIPPGPYYVTSAHSFRCLEAVPSPPNTNGNKVQLWDCKGYDWQKWYFWNINSNNYLIANKYHGRILDADLNTICCNGTRMQVWDHIPGNLNQTWWLWTDGLGLYIQTNYPMPTPRLLDADLNTICCNGTKVQLWDPNRNNNQSWAGPPRP